MLLRRILEEKFSSPLNSSLVLFDAAIVKTIAGFTPGAEAVGDL